MTRDEFVQAAFSKGDHIVVKQYFSHRNEELVSVDFMEERINGYPIANVEEHIKPSKQDEDNQ